MITLIITCFVNQFPGISYEVTDQNSEGIFSSLSRNFDKTLEHINSGDKSATTTSDNDDKKASDKEDDKKASDKEDDRSDIIKSESTPQSNIALENSNGTKTDTSENELSDSPSLVNSTESVEIKPIDLKT